ncbi:MAG: hypothetical protein N2204_00840 [Anaerolineae bacterium]|nr:hypothetical protein [Anaerolineae bacterium]
MKKLFVITILAAALAALWAGTALAAGPVVATPQGFGPGNGIHTPGTGLTAPVTGFGPGAGAGAMRRGAPEWAGASAEVAALLGMTAEQIHAERLAGKSLAQIAAARGISEEQLIQTILNAKKAELAKLVADGKLTQAQMDLMVGHMAEQVKAMVERTNVGPTFNQNQAPNQARPGMSQGFRGGRGATR